MQNITPCLWFNGQAEEAATFYTSIFKNSSIGTILRHGAESAKMSKLPEGSVLTIEFTLDGAPFMGLNGGPHFKFSEAVSFAIDCDTQEEIDYYWNALTAGGEESVCGWLKDKFGVSWQVYSKRMTEMFTDPDKEKAGRAMAAMMQMTKIDLAKIEEAFNG